MQPARPTKGRNVIRRIWFRFHQGQVCGRFVPDPKATFPGVYCKVCKYDRDCHRLYGKDGV